MLFDYNRFLNCLDEYLQQEDDENYITTVNRLLVLSIDKEVTILYEDYPKLCSTLLTTINNILQNKINHNLDLNLLLSIFLSVIQNFNYYESNCRYLSMQPLIYTILDNILTQNNQENVELSIEITLSLSPYVDLDKNEKLENFFHHIFTLPLEDSSKLIAMSVNLISQSVSDVIVQYFIPLITKVINHIKAYDSSNEKELSQILIMFRVLLKYEVIYKNNSDFIQTVIKFLVLMISCNDLPIYLATKVYECFYILTESATTHQMLLKSLKGQKEFHDDTYISTLYSKIIYRCSK